MERARPLRGGLRVEPRFSLALEQSHALERLRRLPHHRLQEPFPALLRDSSVENHADEEPRRLPAGRERDDRDGPARRASAAPRTLRAVPVVGGRQPQAARGVERSVEAVRPRRAVGRRVGAGVSEPAPWSSWNWSLSNGT